MNLIIKTIQTTLIFAIAAVIILSLYLYYAGNEDVYFINKKTLEIHSLPHFINPLKDDAARTLDALEYLKNNPDNKDFFTEVPDNINFESISFKDDKCQLVISFNSADDTAGSFHEDRMLLTVFKTIEAINPSIRIFHVKVEGDYNPFSHISTDFPMKLDNNNIIVTN